MPMIAPAAVALIASLAGDLSPDDAQCRIVHFAADGTRREEPPTRRYTGAPHASASISSTGLGGARSSVSASSSSSASGDGKTTTQVARPGRAITRTYDKSGCTIVVDDRPEGGKP